VLLPESAATRPTLLDGFASCEYVNVFVDRSLADPTANDWERVESIRRSCLEMAVAALPSLGLRIVGDRAEAHWVLSASGLVGPSRTFGIFVELTAELELQRDLYVAELDDAGFPYRGEIGGNYHFEVDPEQGPETIRYDIYRGVKQLWDLEFEQISALCQMSTQLKEEGWDGMKELRIELAEEIKRVRAARARAHQEKRLQLEVEDPRPLAP
jgi:hypothetical protein